MNESNSYTDPHTQRASCESSKMKIGSIVDTDDKFIVYSLAEDRESSYGSIFNN